MQDDSRSPSPVLIGLLLLSLTGLLGYIAYLYGSVLIHALDLFEGIGLAFSPLATVGLPLGKLIAGSPAAAAAACLIVLAGAGLATRQSSRVLAILVPTFWLLGLSCLALYGHWVTHSLLAASVQSVVGGGPISMRELVAMSEVEKQLTDDLHLYPTSQKTKFTLTNSGAHDYTLTTVAPNNGGIVVMRDRQLKAGQSCEVVFDTADKEKIYGCIVGLNDLFPGRKMQITVLIKK